MHIPSSDNSKVVYDWTVKGLQLSSLATRAENWGHVCASSDCSCDVESYAKM